MNQQPSVSLGWGIEKPSNPFIQKSIVNTFTTMKRCCSLKLEQNSLPYSNLMFINLTSLSCLLFSIPIHHPISYFFFDVSLGRKAPPVSFPFRCFLYQTQGSQAQVDNGLKHRCRSTKPAQQLMNDHQAPASPAWKVNYELSYLSKTRQRIVFGMIHRARIPRSYHGAKLGASGFLRR